MKKIFLLFYLSILSFQLSSQIFNPVNYVSVYPYEESFEEGIGNWRQSVEGAINWKWEQFSTNNNNQPTGPNGTPHGNYFMYVESGGINSPNKTAYLYSPFFDISMLNSPNLSFAYHMYGSQMGSLDFQISLNNSNSWTTVWTRSGDQGNNWLTASINLSSYSSASIVQFRFVGTTGSGALSDIAIDKIRITGSSCGNVANTVLPFFEGFEYEGITDFGTTPDNPICNPTYKWDFYSNSIYGRMQLGKDAADKKTGEGAVTLDKSINGINYALNFLILTLDLSNYTSSTGLKMSIDYRNHWDDNHSQDKIWVRGSTSNSWIEVFDWNSSSSSSSYYRSQTINLSAFLNSNSQIPSSTFQVRIGQYDNNHAANNFASFSDGLSIDNLLITDENNTDCDEPQLQDLYVTYTSPVDVALNCSLTSGIGVYHWQWSEFDYNSPYSWLSAYQDSSFHNHHFIPDLDTATTYKYRVRTYCAITKSWSNWSVSDTFRTKNFDNIYMPKVGNDTIYTEINTITVNNIIYNDIDEDNNELQINTNPITPPLYGTVIIRDDGIIRYTPDSISSMTNVTFPLVDEFTYQVCDNGVPSLCNTGKVTIFIEDSLSIPDFNSISCSSNDTISIVNHQSVDGIIDSLGVFIECSGDAMINKPLIFIEPFELGDDKWDTSIAFNTLELLFDSLKSENYDIIYLDLYRNNSYIQNNAYLVQRVIKAVNAINGVDSLVVIGASMGGLIARYAIADMEQRGEQHRVKLYGSIDSPHRGANIPLGIQYFGAFFNIPFLKDEPSNFLDSIIYENEIFNINNQTSLLDIISFFNTHISVPNSTVINKIQEITKFLETLVLSGNSPAAHQMLLLQSEQSTLEFNNLFNWVNYTHQNNNALENQLFMQEYQTLGLPKYSRNIAISNASVCDELQKNQSNEIISLNEEILLNNENDPVVFKLIIDAGVNSSPVGSTSNILYLNLGLLSVVNLPEPFEDISFFMQILTRNLNVQGSDVIQRDILPGGKIEFNLDNLNLSATFSFVPTSSALDIPLYSTDYENTPFDNYLLFDKENTIHVKGANHEEAVKWLIAELRGTPYHYNGCGTLPDLSIPNDDFEVLPDSLIFYHGDTINISAIIYNQGDTISNSTSTAKVYLSINDLVDSLDFLLDSLTIPVLDVDESDTITISNIIPNNIPFGLQYLLVKVDADEMIEEKIEENNIAKRQILIKDTTTIVVTPDSSVLPVTWEVNETNQQHVILIPYDVISFIDSSALMNGDYIGAFYTVDNTISCGGAVEWNDTAVAVLKVNGDDLQTPVKDGFDFNEEFQLKVFRPSTNQEYTVSAYYITNEEDTLDLVNATDSFRLAGFSIIDSIFTIDTLYLAETSCNPSDTGTSIRIVRNQYNIDSIIITTTTIVDADTIYLTEYSCNPMDTGTVSLLIQHPNDCDSLIVIATLLQSVISDTTYLLATTCNPNEVGETRDTITNISGCDSLVVTNTTLATDTTYLIDYVCHPNDTGIVSIVDTNQFGCDSTLVIDYILAPRYNDTTHIYLTTCNPDSTGIITLVYENEYSCDSTVITITSLLPSDTTYLYVESCNPLDVGIDTSITTNYHQCDSLVITTTTLFPRVNDTTQIHNVVCDIAQVGIFVNTLPNLYGCDSIIITTNTLSSFKIDSLTTINSNCGVTNGSMTAHISGGFSPYDYFWTKGGTANNPTASIIKTTIDGSTKDSITGLYNDIYYVMVRDSNNCLDSLQNVIFSNPYITLDTINPSCFGDSTGIITPTFHDASPPFQYLWIPTGDTTSTLTNIPAGNYAVEITDSYGCIRTKTVTLNEPAEIILGLQDLINPTTCLSMDGSITINPQNGVPPYTYAWSNGGSSIGNGTNNVIPNLNYGNYNITVTDNSNCSVTKALDLTNLAPGWENHIIQPTALFDTINTNFETITFVNNSIDGVLYEWNFGDGTTLITDKDSTVTHVFPNSDTFQVSLIVYGVDACVPLGIDTVTSPLEVIYTDIDYKIRHLSELKVLPNPNNGYFNLLIKDLPFGQWNTKIQNMLGQTLYYETIEVYNNEMLIPMTLNNASKGMYLVVMENEKGHILTRKFVLLE